jgi:tRNA pseudouridine55 synthase
LTEAPSPAEQPQDGLVVVDKPSGWTSHQVVGRCRRLYGTRKVGHAGTLDPMATGVLLVGVGRATRLLGHLAGHDKTYTATIQLGVTTVTDDAEGDVVEWRGAAGVTEADVRAAVPAFTGVISQVPSAVSAIKVGGKRAYARVRAGEQVELKAREVTVSRFTVTGVRPSASFGWLHGEAVNAPPLDVDVEVDCSSGTYIRALARDLGASLGTGGHLTALRRTRVGAFDLSMVGLDEDALEAGRPAPLLGLAEVARRAFPVVEVDAARAVDVSHGRPLELEVPAGVTALVSDDRLLALYRPGPDGGSVPVAVLAGS